MIDPLILTRSVHIAATVLASGTVCFMALVADVPALRRRMNLMIWIALMVAILSGAGWLLLLASEIFDAPIMDVCLHGGAWQVATDTRFGLVWCARLLLALSLGVLMLWPAARWPPLIAAAGLIALLGLIGHAGATPDFAGSVHLAADMVHLLAAGAWLGALPALTLLLAQAQRSSEPSWRSLIPAATERFSRLGIICVCALLASGVINSWNLLGGPRDLVATDYGRLVLIKIGLFVAIIGIAAVNKYHLILQLPAPGALRALQRNSLVETGLGLGVLMFVGALGTMAPTAHVHITSAKIPPDAAFVHIHATEAMADVTIAPGRPGRVTAIIHVTREDFSDFSAKVVSVALDPPTPDGKTVERATKRMLDGSWHADDLDIPQPGIWTLRITVTPKSGQPILLDAPIVVEP